MSETEETPRTYSGAFFAAVAIALVGAIGGLIWCATLGSRLGTQQTELTEARQQNAKMAHQCNCDCGKNAPEYVPVSSVSLMLCLSCSGTL